MAEKPRKTVGPGRCNPRTPSSWDFGTTQWDWGLVAIEPLTFCIAGGDPTTAPPTIVSDLSVCSFVWKHFLSSLLIGLVHCVGCTWLSLQFPQMDRLYLYTPHGRELWLILWMSVLFLFLFYIMTRNGWRSKGTLRRVEKHYGRTSSEFASFCHFHTSYFEDLFSVYSECFFSLPGNSCGDCQANRKWLCGPKKRENWRVDFLLSLRHLQKSCNSFYDYNRNTIKTCLLDVVQSWLELLGLGVAILFSYSILKFWLISARYWSWISDRANASI